jgi:hypothetical protein
MNQRIQELYIKTLSEECSNPALVDIEKFAELIVRECADLCDRFQARDVGMQPAECAGAIRKMFGVE